MHIQEEQASLMTKMPLTVFFYYADCDSPIRQSSPHPRQGKSTPNKRRKQAPCGESHPVAACLPPTLGPTVPTSSALFGKQRHMVEPRPAHTGPRGPTRICRTDPNTSELAHGMHWQPRNELGPGNDRNSSNTACLVHRWALMWDAASLLGMG